MKTKSIIIQNLFQLLQENKTNEVVKLYAKNAYFTDGIFQLENVEDIGKMWQYLASIFKDLRINILHIEEINDEVIVSWESFYLLRGKAIHNKLKSRFLIKDGLIIYQIDSFNFYRIARQTSGFKGWLLGWLPSVKITIQNRMLGGFEQYIKAN